MPATPADIAAYTVDGQVVTAVDAALHALITSARDSGDQPIETFYDTAADALAMLNQKFAVLSRAAAPHEAAEVDQRIDIAALLAASTSIPRFQAIDETRALDEPLRLRAYVDDRQTDRFSLELTA